MEYDFPHGFVLSESALYAFVCQEVYPDVVSFAAAIPEHLKPLFLIPIQVQFGQASIIASRLASKTSGSEDAEMFGTKTFVNDDNEPSSPSTDPGSIFEHDDAESLTKHQEYDFDQNIQVPSDTSYNSDIDVTDSGFSYPYRTKEKVKHSSIKFPPVLITNLRVALKPKQLENHAPAKIKENAKSVSVKLVSYDKNTRVFTFSADSGNGPKIVQAKLSEIDQVSMSCNCPFWRWNGPEFHAKENSFMLESPFGTAQPPDVRDPDRKYWLCKHAYAVLRRLDSFVQDVVDENWDKDEDDMLDVVDEEWDRLEDIAQVPLEEIEEDDIDIDVNWDEAEDEAEPDEYDESDESEEDEEDEFESEEDEVEPEEDEPEEEPEEDEPEAEDESEEYEVDLSELESKKKPEDDYEEYQVSENDEDNDEDYEDYEDYEEPVIEKPEDDYEEYQVSENDEEEDDDDDEDYEVDEEQESKSKK